MPSIPEGSVPTIPEGLVPSISEGDGGSGDDDDDKWWNKKCMYKKWKNLNVVVDLQINTKQQ